MCSSDLDARYKGKMVWNATPSSSAGQGFVGSVIMEWGEARARAYFEKLARQNVTAVKASARQILDLAIAGEYSIALQIFNNHAPISRKRGAPVGWLKIEPGLAVILPMSLTKGAPRPNAGKLLFEFILSEEGQKIMADSGELPVLPSVSPLEPDLRPGPAFRARYIAPAALADSVAGWTKIYDEYFK